MFNDVTKFNNVIVYDRLGLMMSSSNSNLTE